MITRADLKDENKFQEIKRVFYSCPDFIRERQKKELGFMKALMYEIFVAYCKKRAERLEKKLATLRKALEQQERNYVLVSYKFLYTKKFVDSLLKDMRN